MNESLKGKTVAILIADGFEQSEMVEPKKALEAAGAKTVIISPKGFAAAGNVGLGAAMKPATDRRSHA